MLAPVVLAVGRLLLAGLLLLGFLAVLPEVRELLLSVSAKLLFAQVHRLGKFRGVTYWNRRYAALAGGRRRV